MFGLETRFIHLNSNSSANDVSPNPAETAQALIITGLEDAPPPVHMRLRNEIVRAESARKAPLVVWVRGESADEASIPAWLVRYFLPRF